MVSVNVPGTYDVNVTPDKRTVFIKDEDALLDVIRVGVSTFLLFLLPMVLLII